MSKRKRWLMLGLLLLAVLLAWLFWPDRRVAQAKALQKELFGPQAKGLSPEQRREKGQQLRKLREKMTPAQREALAAEGRKRRQAEMARYFKMSAADKLRHLDDRIRRGEQMRQQFQAKGGSGGAAQPGGNRSAASRDQGRQNRLDSSSPGERALFSQYMKELNARRGQLGMPPRR